MAGASYLLAQGNAERLPLPDRSVDLVFGSPPYCDARTYGIGAQRDCLEWVDWMLSVTTEAVRVSRGLVLWVVAGVTRDHCYWPACEGLLYEWWRRGGHCWRPAYWHRVGIPGSGGKKWLRADVEYVLCFKAPGVDFWADNTAMGHPPKWAPGGEMSHRLSDGTRTNQWGKTGSGTGTVQLPGGVVWSGGTRPSHRRALVENGLGAFYGGAGERRMNGEQQYYIPPVLANPGNFHEWDFESDEAAWHEQAVIHTNVGGGAMGSNHAHSNEAPFPEDLAEFFVRSFCPPGGTVLDCFSGSATTAAVALRLGRNAIGIDLRRSQCELGARRISRPHAPVPRPARGAAGPGQQTLFT